MSAASNPSKAAAPVIALFRAILRLHRDRLPPPMRAFGDTLVKDEFSKHLKNPKTTEAQWRTFMSEWQHYHAMLAGNADLLANLPGSGAAASAAQQGQQAQQQQAATTTTAAAATGSCGELSGEVLEMMTPDQRARLAQLRSEAGRFGRELLAPEDGSAVGAAGEGAGAAAAAASSGGSTGAQAAQPSGNGCGSGGCGCGSA